MVLLVHCDLYFGVQWSRPASVRAEAERLREGVGMPAQGAASGVPEIWV